MRKLVILATFLTVTVLTNSLGLTTLAEATSCTTTCPISVLSCNATTCSSVTGSTITCDGVTTQCNVADNWCLCTLDCQAAYDSCLPKCGHGLQNCINACGSQPLFIQNCSHP